jgi:miniconductance mechanosensitive channel
MEQTNPQPTIGKAAEWATGLHDWLEAVLPGDRFGTWTSKLAVVAVTVAVAWLAHFITRNLTLAVIRKMAARTRTRWDDQLVERGFFDRLAWLVPAVIVYLAAPMYAEPFVGSLALDVVLMRLTTAWLVVVILRAISALLNAAADIYDTLDRKKANPISGFVGGLRLVLWIVGLILCIAAITGRDPSGLVAGIGALTAVLLLVFKDSILGLVASIQIFVNDLVRVGDWIEMPTHGVDGDVIAVSLTTVKVQNWDRTIATIPSYSVISESFKNWRGMQDSDGRRIKRSISIDMNSVEFCTAEQIDRFGRFALLADYVAQKQSEVAEYNEAHGIDNSEMINGRRMTNLGTFRAYLLEYLRRHTGINNDMTLLVRQLAPSAEGVPIEIYVFSLDKDWGVYESLQADIFDHLLSVVGDFGLRVFQSPTGVEMAAGMSGGQARSLGSDAAGGGLKAPTGGA